MNKYLDKVAELLEKEAMNPAKVISRLASKPGGYSHNLLGLGQKMGANSSKLRAAGAKPKATKVEHNLHKLDDADVSRWEKAGKPSGPHDTHSIMEKAYPRGSI